MSALKRRIRSAIIAAQGTAALEFAFLLPVLVILMAGGFEFGRAFWHHHLVNKGVRDATRYLTRVPAPLAAEFTTVAENLVLRGSMDSSAPMLLPEWESDPSLVDVQIGLKTYDNSAGTFRGPDGGIADIDVVQVTAEVVYPGIGLLALVGFPDGITFFAQHEERYLGE